MTNWEYAYMTHPGLVTVLRADGSDEVYSEASKGPKDSDLARRGRMLAMMGAAGWEFFHSDDEVLHSGTGPRQVGVCFSGGISTYWFKRPISS